MKHILHTQKNAEEITPAIARCLIEDGSIYEDFESSTHSTKVYRQNEAQRTNPQTKPKGKNF